MLESIYDASIPDNYRNEFLRGPIVNDDFLVRVCGNLPCLTFFDLKTRSLTVQIKFFNRIYRL